MVVNGLLTSTLWYHATSLSLPSWAVAQIEEVVYRFFWNNKHPLVNRGILSVPLKDGGFNVARLELKIKALRLNTLRRLLTGEEAHWKHFTSHFLRVSGKHPGKLTLATDFAPRDIDSNVPAFHKELLCAWINDKCYHERTDVPDSLSDIFEEPLFKNKLINVNNKPLFSENGFHAASFVLKVFAMKLFRAFCLSGLGMRLLWTMTPGEIVPLIRLHVS